MKKFFLLNFVFLLMLSSNLFSDLKFRIKEGDKIIEKTLPDGSNAVSITFKDSVIKTFYIGKNIKKDVIIEFETPPVKTYRGQKDFNFKENNRLIESVKLEQAKFYNDIERIIKNKSKLKDTTLQDAEYKVYFSYRIALNGIALHTTQWVIDEIQKLDYVKKVHEVVEVKINDDESNHVIRADSVWYNLGVTGEGVLIAIIDTGIDSNHVALNNGKVVGGYNFISDKNDFFDDHGHGTHCAGIAAANGGGLTGAAPGASLMGVKVLDAGGGGYDFQIIAGIEYSLDPDGNPNTNDGVDIISMSIGGGGDPDDAMSTAVDNAVINGVLCAVAAGNSGSSYTTIESPGCARLALTVGASDNYDNIAYFSSRGPVSQTFDIKPDIVAPGVNVYSSLPYNNFGSESGTSMATPHIAGAAALLKELHPDWTPQELKSAFMGTAVDVGADIWSQGSGRVDVYKVAQTSSVLTPSSINFGFVDKSETIWTKSDTLQIYNYSNESKTYYLTLEHDFPEGFSYTLEPESIEIDANSSTQIIFTISVDNSVFPASGVDPPTFHGKIVAQSGDEAVETNFIFAKARMLNISFDELPFIVVIHNRKNLSYAHFWKQYINQVVPIDTFDIIAFFDDNDGFTYPIKEDIIVQSDSGLNIFIQKTEAQNDICFKYQDLNSNQIWGWEVGLLEFIHYAGVGLSIFGGMNADMHFSSFSDRYTLQNLRNGYFNDGNNNYESYTTSFSVLNGIDSSETIFINPNNSKRIHHNYKLNGRNGDYYLTDWIGKDDFTSSSAAAVTHHIFNTFRPPYNRNHYYRFCGNTDFWKEKTYTEEIADFPMQFMASPIIKLIDDTVHFFSFNKTDEILHFGKKEDTIKINQSFPVFKSRTNNQSNKIVLNSYDYAFIFVDIYPAIFQDIYGYNVKKSIELKLKNANGELLDSISISNYIDNVYENNSIEPGYYELELKYDNYLIGYYPGNIGNAIATLKFNNAEDDKDPPYIKKLLITKDSIVKDFYLKNDTIKISSIIRDDYNVDSVKFFYKRVDSEEWIQLETENYDDNYFTSINPLDSLGYYSIKIKAKDFSDNILIYQLEPALKIVDTIPLAIEIDSVTDITYNSIKVHSSFIENGGLEPSEYGICWNLEGEPSLLDYQIKFEEDYFSLGIIFFDNVIRGLKPNTKYYLRAYTKNNYGVYYSNQVVIETKELVLGYSLYGWGLNTQGRLGLGDLFSIHQPEKIPSANVDWERISCGENHSLATKTNNTLWGCGYNVNGELGDGTNVNKKNIALLRDFANCSQLSAGVFHSLAIKTDGTFWGWGYGTDLGINYYESFRYPIQIGSDSNWCFCEAGLERSFAIKNNGTLWACGQNYNYELGDGTNEWKGFFTQIGSDSNWVKVKSGRAHTLALKNDSTLWGWGYGGNGQLGNYSYESRQTPFQIGTDSNWVDIGAGWNFSIGIKSDGTLWSWGDNDYGQLGDGTNEPKNYPEQVDTSTNWISISTGAYHSVALKSDSTLWAWGFNGYAQIGDSTHQSRNIPVNICPEKKWIQVEAGSYHNMALSCVFPPQIVTDSVKNITCFGVDCGGMPIDDGDDSIQSKGVVYGFFEEPVIDSIDCFFTNEGGGNDIFVSHLTDLIPDTTYFIRAYATNDAGVGYGEQFTFKTYSTKPAVYTDSVTQITSSSVLVKGNLIYPGVSNVSQVGFCYNTIGSPTLDDSHTSEYGDFTSGTFTSQIFNLNSNTTYYIRAYANNEAGTGYGNDLVFSTPPAQFNLIGGGSYCEGNDGVEISLDGSEIDINYFLLLDGVDTTASIIGTGNSISFGYQTLEGTYTVTATSPNTNQSIAMLDSAIVSINQLPTATISGATAICAGESAELSVELTGTAPFELEFSDGFIANGIETTIYIREVSPEETTEYSIANVTDANCSNTGEGTATITVNALPTATISGTTSICIGENAELSVELTGTAPFELEFSDGFIANDIETTTYLREVNPAATTEYSIVEVTDINCSNAGDSSATITVNPLPTATISGTTDICFGESAELSVELTGTAPFTVEFSDGFIANDIETTTYLREVSPEETTEYSIANVTDENCSNTGEGTATITVNALPTATLSGATTICIGESAELSVELTGTAPFTVEFSDGFIANDIETTTYLREVSPEETTEYSIVEVTYANCSNTGDGTATITVNALPTATLSGATTICIGESAELSVELTGMAPFTVEFSDGFIANNIVTTTYLREVNPEETTEYSIIEVTGANCSNTGDGTATITVNSLPTATLSGATAICVGESVELSVELFGIAPFSLEFSDGFIANGIETTIYIREVSPEETTEYSIANVTDANCSNTGEGTATITVNALPTATISGTTSICFGESAELSVELTGTAPFTVEFSDGFIANNIQNSPYLREVSSEITTEYSIIEVADANCSNTGDGTATITVNSLPTATLSGATTICFGESAELSVELTGTAPFTVEFNDGFIESDIIESPYLRNVSPETTTEYSIVEVTDANCSNTGDGTATITVNALPTATISGATAICAGESAELSVELTGTAPFELEFSDGFIANGIETTIYIREVSPEETTEYSIANVTDANCSNTGEGTATITVNALPTATISGTTSICIGENAELSVELTGTAPFELEFSDGFIANDIETTTYLREVNPAATTEYSIVEVTDINCSNAGDSSATITVNPLPTATISGTTDICFGESAELSVELTGTAPFTVEFSNGFIANNIQNSPYLREVSPEIITEYSIIEVADANCSNTGDGIATITVNPLPTATISGTTTICFGESAELSVELTGTAPFTVEFNDGFIESDIAESPYIRNVSPETTTEYSIVEVTDANCSNAGDGTATITVNSLPTATLSGATTICFGESAELSVELTGTAPFTVEFNDGFIESDIIESPYLRNVSPETTTEYSIIEVTNANCSNTGDGTAIITVYPLPTLFNVTGSGSYYEGQDGVEIGLDGSETGVDYELFVNDETTEIILNGTGDSLNFGKQTTEGIYTVKATLVEGYCSSAMLGNAEIIIIPLAHQDIEISSGWNIISSYINPKHPDMFDVFEDVTNNINVVKNGAGQMFIPQQEFNNIGDWNIAHGYLANANIVLALTVEGVHIVPEETPLSLNGGWNLVSYLRNSAMNPALALASVENTMLLCKNNEGGIYYPSFGVNTLGNMLPGQGYWIHTNQSGVLTYPENSAGKIIADIELTPLAKQLVPIYKNTGNNATLILKLDGIENGAEVGVYNVNDELIGSGAVHNGVAAVTIWGDDEITKQVDGAVHSELLSVKLLNSISSLNNLSLYNIKEITGNTELNNLTYKTNAIYLAKATVQTNDELAFSINCVPNPAANSTTFEFSLADDNNAEIVVYSLRGDEIAKLRLDGYSAGMHRVVFNTDDLANGSYNVVLRSGTNYTSTIMMIVK